MGKGRGCVDQAYSLAQTVLNRLEKQKGTFLCFVDLKKAYDSVWRDGLFRKMEQEGVPLKLVRAWYHGVSVRVRVNDVLSSSFVTKVGVRQGDTLSPLLFNIFINGIVQKVKEDGDGGELGDFKIPVLLFADDMVLIADRKDKLERMVEKVRQYCKEWRLEVNVNKTKVMVVSKDGEKVVKVKYGEEELECVKQYPLFFQ